MAETHKMMRRGASVRTGAVLLTLLAESGEQPGEEIPHLPQSCASLGHVRLEC